MTPEQLRRYSRQVILPEVGEAGQERLLQAKVLIVGLGGLGCPAALYLAAAGVGTLGLVDFDSVDASNLQRQVLYSSGDAGKPKVPIAAQRLRELNPDIQIREYQQRLSADNALDIISGYDYVTDGTDNFPTRYLVNDACVLARKVNIYGSILRFEGQVSVLAHAQGPCYRCLFPQPPKPGDVPNCAEAGVFGVLPGLIGTAQATETLKLILGIGEPLIGRLLILDALSMNWQSMQVQRAADCPICGDHPSIRQVKEIPFVCQTDPDDVASLSPGAVAERVQEDPDGTVLLDVRTRVETHISSISGAVNIPLDELEKRVGEVRAWNDKTVFVFCQAGMRSLKAIELLHKEGIQNLVNIDGGISRWEKEVSS
jgi:molybdopterin/thiamine biosynthesis adenylyltransferase/rhodanese-related sulfurtransferase